MIIDKIHLTTKNTHTKSHELRELEAKLRAAYVAKERQAQMAEKEALKFDSLLEDAEIMKRMKAEAEQAEAEQAAQAHARHAEMSEYKRDLQRQLEERERGKQAEYEEFLREKLLIDEIVRKIHEEDARELERKMLARQATREYVDEFKRQREAWKQAERERMEAENRRIVEYARVQQQRDERAKAEKKAREAHVEQLQQKLMEKIERDREQRDEMERVRQELYLEEQEELARNHDRVEMERKLRQRLELQKQVLVSIIFFSHSF